MRKSISCLLLFLGCWWMISLNGLGHVSVEAVDQGDVVEFGKLEIELPNYWKEKKNQQDLKEYAYQDLFLIITSPSYYMDTQQASVEEIVDQSKLELEDWGVKIEREGPLANKDEDWEAYFYQYVDENEGLSQEVKMIIASPDKTPIILLMGSDVENNQELTDEFDHLLEMMGYDSLSDTDASHQEVTKQKNQKLNLDYIYWDSPSETAGTFAYILESNPIIESKQTEYGTAIHYELSKHLEIYEYESDNSMYLHYHLLGLLDIQDILTFINYQDRQELYNTIQQKIQQPDVDRVSYYIEYPGKLIGITVDPRGFQLHITNNAKVIEAFKEKHPQ